MKQIKLTSLTNDKQLNKYQQLKKKEEYTHSHSNKTKI